jgi:hypothetical protein
MREQLHREYYLLLTNLRPVGLTNLQEYYSDDRGKKLLPMSETELPNLAYATSEMTLPSSQAEIVMSTSSADTG